MGSDERGKGQDTKGQESGKSGNIHAERKYERMAGRQRKLENDWWETKRRKEDTSVELWMGIRGGINVRREKSFMRNF